METISIEIENDQTIAHNQDTKSGGDNINRSNKMEVITLEKNISTMCQFFIAEQSEKCED